VLASTRMLAGPMDYTPGGFNNVTRAEFSARRIDPMVLGTRTHQLALYVVFECPFQMVPDHPSAYDNLPEFRFIQDVPVTWDETRVIDGKVGDYITIARRHGREWYLGSITDWSPRVLDIPLRFLDRGEYTAEVYADTEGSPKNVAIETVRVHRSTRLKAHLASGGGYAVRPR
jgi:alpha-glucosidase